MKVYFDEDADLSYIEDKTIGCIGYGHQGHAQAQNLRDMGVNVIVGELPEMRKVARKDGFKDYSIEDVAEKGDILLILIPDEVQAEVYKKMIMPKLRKGKVLDFAHGYNINYHLIIPPEDVDVIMVAPRMIGEAVRERFKKGLGSPAAIDVYQDYTGNAWSICKALAKGIGATRLPGGGAFELSFEAEVELDLFTEQATWPAVSEILLSTYEVLVKAGYPQEAVALELYGSKEAAEVFEAMADYGFFNQMFMFHSRTAQYGEMTRAKKIIPSHLKDKIRKNMICILEDIKDGTFVREWNMEQMLGSLVFEKLKEKVLLHPINAVERNIEKIFRRKKEAKT